MDSCTSTPAGSLPPQVRLESQARLFKALSDPNRLWLLHRLLEGEVCVCDLLSELSLSQATLSHHLKVLLEAQLVRSRRSGRWNFYQTTLLGRSLLSSLEDLPMEAPAA